MKKIFSILLFIFLISNVLGQNNLPKRKINEKSFPTNIDGRNFTDLKNFNGKIVAFNGIIEANEMSRNSTPFYKLKLDNNNYLWTVLMFKNEISKIGDTLKVVGYLRPVPAELNEIEKKYLKGKYMVIAFGLVDAKNANFLFLDSAELQKQEWIEGKIPSSE
jgi:hypothetical protein